MNHGGFAGIVFLAVLLGLYFVPSIIAVARKHAQTAPIVLINLFLGWTFIGWIVVFAWAFANQRPPVTVVAATPATSPDPAARGHNDDAAAIERFAKLRDEGVISTEEFEAKKRAILG